MNHSEKVETALATYLKAFQITPPTNPWPASLLDSTSTARIFPGEDDSDKEAQCIVCIMDEMQEEYPESSGNRHALVRVELRTPNLTTASAADPLGDHVTAAGVLETALLADTLAASLTAAISDFTVMSILDRRPIAEETEDQWMTGYAFRLYSCPKSF